jgi:cytochrome c oxidase cbb3-type subunit 3
VTRRRLAARGRRRAAGAVAAALFAWPACDRAEPPPAAPSAMASVVDPVGPVPGEGEPAPRANPFDGAPDRQMGRQLFAAMNCAGCHGEHAGGGMGPSLRDEVWIYGGEAGDIFDSIVQGRANGMPAWGTRLPSEHIWRITAYVRSLRTPDEPDPPR